MSDAPPTLAALHPGAPPVLAVVLGDFGRDAALRFTAALATRERDRVRALLGAAPFYDEYRRITLALVGDLPFAKAPLLAGYRDRALDDGVLVGFGGVGPDRVADRLGVLALEAMAGPLRRGVRDVRVLLPCNTLAPVSWALAERFADRERLAAMLARADAAGRGDLARTADRLAGVTVRFPTVPGAALTAAAAAGATAVLPMGTLGIAAVYREAARRAVARRVDDPARPTPPAIDEPDVDGARDVLAAIQAAIAGDADGRRRADRALRALAERVARDRGEPVLAIEACTDLDYGVGLDSNAAYADAVVDAVYSAR